MVASPAIAAVAQARPSAPSVADKSLVMAIPPCPRWRVAGSNRSSAAAARSAQAASYAAWRASYGSARPSRAFAATILHEDVDEQIDAARSRREETEDRDSGVAQDAEVRLDAHEE